LVGMWAQGTRNVYQVRRWALNGPVVQ
jgi:hypothetical protein